MMAGSHQFDYDEFLFAESGHEYGELYYNQAVKVVFSHYDQTWLQMIVFALKVTSYIQIQTQIHLLLVHDKTENFFVSIGYDNTIQQYITIQYSSTMHDYIIEHYTNNMSRLIKTMNNE